MRSRPMRVHQASFDITSAAMKQSKWSRLLASSFSSGFGHRCFWNTHPGFDYWQSRYHLECPQWASIFSSSFCLLSQPHRSRLASPQHRDRQWKDRPDASSSSMDSVLLLNRRYPGLWQGRSRSGSPHEDKCLTQPRLPCRLGLAFGSEQLLSIALGGLVIVTREGPSLEGHDISQDHASAFCNGSSDIPTVIGGGEL